MKIAGLLTCYNRASKTEACLKRLQQILSKIDTVELFLFITNDGSTDGTQKMLEEYQTVLNITIIKGDGNMFWSGGMRAAWNKALELEFFDGFLWINDDTCLKDSIFDEIIASQAYCMRQFKQCCISVGATAANEGGKLTYSGMKNRQKIVPTDTFQLCEMSNGNIVYIPMEVVRKIGIIDKFYKHGIGDIDYTYTAYKKGIPIVLMRGYCGYCENDHNSKYGILCNKTILERYKYVMSPLGFQMREYIYFNKKFWPWKLPLVALAICSKIFCPKLEMKLRGINQQ